MVHPETSPGLLEQQMHSEHLFKGSFFEAFRDTVLLPDGNTTTREYLRHPGAVVAVPLLDDGRVLLERQFRYPVGQVMIEFPAGKLNPGEDPLHCAQRELLEETGYTAREWARAGIMHLAIAYSTEVIHIYFARSLTPGARQLDEGELLETFSARPAQLQEWARKGELTDAKTLSCLTWLQNTISGAWTLAWQDSALATRPASG
jgi:ADP-ribose pyrophosphatase